MKIGITGASGFIGKNLKDHLNQIGHEIIPISHKLKFHNLQTLLETQKPECVVHLATLFIAEHKSGQINALVDGNIRFGTDLLEAMAKSNVKKLIAAGTSWQNFGPSGNVPNSLYAATKTAFQEICKYYFVAHNISSITLKIYDTYGPGDPRPKLLNKLIGALAGKTPSPEMSPGNQHLHLVHIRDIVCAFELAINNINIASNQCTEYFLPSKQSLSLRELVDQISRVAGHKLSVNFGALPYRKMEIMSPWDRGETLPNWSPKVELAEGLKELVQSIKFEV